MSKVKYTVNMAANKKIKQKTKANNYPMKNVGTPKRTT